MSITVIKRFLLSLVEKLWRFVYNANIQKIRGGVSMQEIIKMLDENLECVDYNFNDGKIFILIRSNKKEMKCPFCGTLSSKEHSSYKKTVQDLPIQGNKVILLIESRKMFCLNDKCSQKTFGERFSFLSRSPVKTDRLIDEIIAISLNCSSVAAAEILSRNTVDIGRSTVSRYIKKRDY